MSEKTYFNACWFLSPRYWTGFHVVAPAKKQNGSYVNFLLNYHICGKLHSTVMLVVKSISKNLKICARSKNFLIPRSQREIMKNHQAQIRSSHQRCSMKKGGLRNFTKFTGKHLCQSLFFNKVAGLRPATLFKRPWHRCFPVNFAKFLRTPVLTEHLRWLLLYKKFLCNHDNPSIYI